VVLLLLIAVELPPSISLILCLCNNNLILLNLDLIVLEVSLIIYIAYKVANWLRSVLFYPPLEPLVRVT